MITHFNSIPYDMYPCTLGQLTEDTALIIEKLMNIYLARFTYEDLPDEMAETIGNFNYFDSVLFFNPSGCFCDTGKYGIQFLPTTGAYEFNIIGRPVKWTAYGFKKFKRQYSVDNSVLMINDNVCSIPFLHLLHEAKFMVDLDNTVRQNIMAQRQPYIIEGEPDLKSSMDDTWRAIAEWEPFIYAHKHDKRNPEPIETKVFQTDVEYRTKDYMDSYAEFLNRCLTYMGINNITVQNKRERLIVNEATANDIYIQSFYTSALKQREYAIDHANKMFNLHMKVHPTDLQTMQSAVSSELQMLMTAGGNTNEAGGSFDGNPVKAKDKA